MADQKPYNISIEFTITQDMLLSFARLSGDYNSMHMNAEIARKSRFRQPIVHGMLPFSFLSVIQKSFPQQRVTFKELSGHFNKPMYIGDLITLNISLKERADKLYSFSAKWHRKETSELLLLAKGKLALNDDTSETATNTASDNRDSFLNTATTENQYTITELGDQHEKLLFNISTKLAIRYAENVQTSVAEYIGHHKLCPNLLATLLLSTMVGMRLPGRYATFTRFDITFDQDLAFQQMYELHAILDKTSVEAEHIIANCEIRFNDNKHANGKYEVVVNSPPKVMLSCTQIKQTAMDFGLDGKVALITGASRGIGETTAKLLAMHGVKTIINYFRGESDAQEIVKNITDAGGEAFSVQCDLTNDKQVRRMMQQIYDKYGDIDILVNNAVKEFTPKDVLELEWKDYLNEMEVSVKGMHACCKSVIPMFKKAGQGKIINLSTVAVANPVSGQSRYITAKSAVEGYTKSLAVELAQSNIQVNLVVPNMTDTDLISVIPTSFRNRIANERAAQRHVHPIEVAQSIVYLAGNWSNAMTGQKIVLNLGEPPFA